MIEPFKHKNLNINLNLKSMCNLRCDYCALPEHSKSTNIQDATLLKNIDILLSKMVSEGYTWDFCMLIGAEPLMAKPETIATIFNKILEVYPNCRLKIQTNGTLFTEEYADRLENNMNVPEQLLIGWSLDGVKNIHDTWRDNSYDTAVHNLFTTNKTNIFNHSIIMSVGPMHFEDENKKELLWFTNKCLEEGVHPTFSVVDYKINENSNLDMNIANKELWKPFADFLIENNIIHLCEKYFNPSYCRREGNECSRVLFDLSDGGVYQCEKTFDIKGATLNNFLYNTIEDCMYSRRCTTANCHIDPECFNCEFWDYCRGSCSLKRTDGVAHSCELTKYILTHIKNNLDTDYLAFLKRHSRRGKRKDEQ